MSQDITNLLQKLSMLEGTVTPSDYPKHGLNKQQQQVPQLPALFKPKKISALTSKDNPQHPAKRFFVGAESKESYCDACDRPESECICDGKDCDLTQTQNEDVLTTVRRGLNDYLKSLEKSMEPDRGLADKAKDAIQQPPLEKLVPIKTIATHDGKQIRIHGNEHDGFVIKINDKPITHHFETLDEAELACEMYCNHRRQAEKEIQGRDYVDEA